MLRFTALVLLLANLAYFAWSQGHMAPLGWAPQDAREPQRLQQQLEPDRLRVEPLPASEASAPDRSRAVAPAPESGSPPADAPPAPQSADTAAEAVQNASSAPGTPAPPAPADETKACYLASGFSPTQAQALRVVMATLPWAPGQWVLEEGVLPERWIVYMGRFADTEALNRKKAELRQLRVEYRDATQLMPGLALGTYSSEAAAQQALADLAPRGVRTARVVKERDEQRSFTLRLNAITPAQRADVEGLNTAMAGKRLTPC